MLTAQEAKKIALNTEKVVDDKILNDFMPRIKTCAEKGEFSCFIDMGAIPFYEVIPDLSALETRVVEKLKSLGYQVDYSKEGSSYVPRGLQDDNGDGTQYQNFGFTINW